MIPRLQREYIQGMSEGIISTLLDKLLDVNSKIDLNYIYGYRKNGYFIPVDGQQRLTTLWLLHIYLSEVLLQSFTTFVEFYNREFAGDFCSSLIKDRHLNKSIRKAKDKGKKLSEIITNEYWFITSWQTNMSVNAMLATLNYIFEKTKQWDNSKLSILWEDLTSDKCHITFDFLEMTEENMLKDDIYIKMNGRGRPLTAFENLKSWIDERIQNKEWGELWKNKIDNEWTSLFWNNRNRNQAKPEEIDDEQEACFASLMLIFWIKNEKLLRKKVETISKLDSGYGQVAFEALLDYYGLTNTAKNENESSELINDIVTHIFDGMLKGTVPSLIWIERLDLMPDSFLEFAKESLDTIDTYAKELNECDLYLNPSTKSVNAIYDICMTSSSYDRTLPLLYALLSCNRHGEKDMFQWMRLLRNLIFNKTIERKDLNGIFGAIDSFSREINSQNILDYLYDNDTRKIFRDKMSIFSSTQLDEEIKKADIKYRKILPYFYRLENSAFFRGRINCIFRLLDSDELLQNKIASYATMLTTILNSSGLNNKFDRNGSFYFRRAIILKGKTLYGIKTDNVYSFCKDAEQWRKFVNDNSSFGFEYFKSVLSDIETNKPNEIEWECHITHYLKELVESASKEFEDMVDSYVGDRNWLYFVHHVGLWTYMESDMAFTLNSQNKFDLFVKPSKGAYRSMNVRTYSLYLDCCHKSDMKEVNEIWKNHNIYPHYGSVFFYDLNIEDYTITIDVLHKRTTDDDYTFKLYVRQYDDENSGGKNFDYFINHNCKDILEEYNIKEKEGERRLYCNNVFSYHSMYKIIKDITLKISERIKTQPK